MLRRPLQHGIYTASPETTRYSTTHLPSHLRNLVSAQNRAMCVCVCTHLHTRLQFSLLDRKFIPPLPTNRGCNPEHPRLIINSPLSSDTHRFRGEEFNDSIMCVPAREKFPNVPNKKFQSECRRALRALSLQRYPSCVHQLCKATAGNRARCDE